MLKLKQKLVQSVFVIAAALSAAAPASAADVTASASGWIKQDNTKNNTSFGSGVLANHYAGYLNGGLYNNWFTFTLPTEEIGRATLNIWNDAQNSTTDPQAIYSLFKAAFFSYSGLMSGPSLGSVTLGEADNGASHYVSIDINSTGLALLNENLGKTFTFSGHTTPTTSSNLCNDCVEVFGYTTGRPAAFLSLQPVPEPETYAMMLAGLGLLGTIARRKKIKA